MSYYPVVGDICRYDSYSDNNHYLVMDVKEELYDKRPQIIVHLLCLDSGEHFEDYIWPRDPYAWSMVT